MNKEDLPKPILIEDLGMMYATENSKRKFRFGLYKCGFCGEEFRTQIKVLKEGVQKVVDVIIREELVKHIKHTD